MILIRKNESSITEFLTRIWSIDTVHVFSIKNIFYKKMDEIIKITPALEKQIKIVIDKYSKNNKKKKGYTEILGWFAKGFLTKGQANKVESFYNNFNPYDQKDKEQKEIYDEVNILMFCQNGLNHIAQTDKFKSKAKSRASIIQKRTVDRMNPLSNAEVKPIKINSTLVSLDEGFEIEKSRIIDIINKTKGGN